MLRKQRWMVESKPQQLVARCQSFKTFSPSSTLRQSKLECLSLANFIDVFRRSAKKKFYNLDKQDPRVQAGVIAVP